MAAVLGLPPLPSAWIAFRTPEHVVILVVERGYEAIANSHVDQGQGTSIFREGMVALLCDLSGCLIEYLCWRRGRIVKRDIRPIHRPIGAGEAAKLLYFVISPGVLITGERRGRGQEISMSVRDAERSYILPVEEGSPRDATNNWAAWRCLVCSGTGGPRVYNVSGEPSLARSAIWRGSGSLPVVIPSVLAWPLGIKVECRGKLAIQRGLTIDEIGKQAFMRSARRRRRRCSCRRRWFRYGCSYR
jgi:hypothetical protein